MSDQIVHDAYERVRSRYADEVWFSLPPRVITDAIYREMRLIDAERLNGRALETSQQASGATA